MGYTEYRAAQREHDANLLDTSPEYDRALEELAVLGETLRPLQDRMHELREKILTMRSRYKVGDIIEWEKGRCKGEVVNIVQFCGDPSWRVKRILKSGGTGQVCSVRDYQEPKLIERDGVKQDV